MPVAQLPGAKFIMPHDMLVRYKHGKSTFELATHPGTVTKYRNEKDTSLTDVLVTDVVFTNYSKGERASDAELRAAFGEGETKEKILEKIIQKGEVQLSAAERKEKLEARRREIIEYIHRNYVDPKTLHPLPVMRIEQALEAIRPRIDTDQAVDRQVAQMSVKLMACMPMKKHQMGGTIKVSHAFLGSANGIIRSYCTVSREHYTSEGAVLEVLVAPGDYDALLKALNSATKGTFQFEIAGASVKTIAPVETTSNTKGKKKGEKKKRATDREVAS